MVKVKFFNLIRSKYNISEIETNPGTLKDIIHEILQKHIEIDPNDLLNAVIFLNNRQVMHKNRLNENIYSNDVLVFTHFVGGG
jgi:molybdopterin converting factor small subunit